MSQFETFLASMDQYKNGEGTYDISIDKFREFITNGIVLKRPQSGYFLWLNKERPGIREKYFSDYESISEWDNETLKKYYEDKGLGTPKKEGKPKIVALVTTKAGILWRVMTDEEKQPFMDKSKMLKEEYSKIMELKQKTETESEDKEESVVNNEEIENEEIENEEIENEEIENEETETKEEVDDEDIDVVEYEYKEKIYYHDEKNNVFYDPDTSKKVAKLIDDKFTFM